ncbi:RNA-directed DNA polymerase, eukaryota, reverse transcriptase zinc-binding domain protein, partial [Tanacetum coccineum]
MKLCGPGDVAREGIPFELFRSTYPGRHVARETYPQRQVARDTPDLSLGNMANVVVIGVIGDGSLDFGAAISLGWCNKEEGSKRNNAPLQPQCSRVVADPAKLNLNHLAPPAVVVALTMNGVEGSFSLADSSSILDQNANYMNIMSMNGGIGFTFMQLEELKLQALIYNYIEAGLPVPSHLILPIWNSVLASFTGSGCDHSLYDNYKNTMEAEPGRCKRTDGKKWRCSKEVVSGHNGLPSPPPLDSFLGLGTQVEETCKPTPSIDSFESAEVTLVDKLADNPLPNFKVSPGHQNNIDGGNSEDKELDELLCSFQKLSDGDGIGEQLKRNKKIKAKHKKKKLVVGGFSPPLGLLSQKNDDFPVDEEAATKLGASGSILTLWDSRVFVMEQCFKEHNFLGVIGSCIGFSSKIRLLNVYAPQSSTSKEAVWRSIDSLLNSSNIIWVVFSDFNVARSPDERNGCLFDVGEACAFNDFISRNGLFDFPLCGRRFTRFDKDGRKASKLDRFLVSASFFYIWKDANVNVLCRSYSDHFPILLKVKGENYGPKPFKIFNKWFNEIGFDELVGLPPPPPLDSFLGLDTQVEETCKPTPSIDSFGPAEVMLVDKLADNPRFLLDIKTILMVVIQRIRNWTNSFAASKSGMFRKLSFTDTSFLDSNFSFDEVKKAVWDCDGSKSPGPNGFNFAFIKTFWDVIKDDFWKCVKMFESSGRLSNGCNPSFIVLIPKKKDPLGFSYFRPISPIGCVYKVISKMLASRLAKVIGSVIGPNQSAFIEGRQILDGCLIANEIIRM